MNVITKLTGKSIAGYAIMTRAYQGRELQSGMTYPTRKAAREAFVARRFTNDSTARIVTLWV